MSGEVHDGECTGKKEHTFSDQTKIEGYFKDAILIDPHDEVSFGTQEDKTNNFVLSTQEQSLKLTRNFQRKKATKILVK